MRRLSRERRLPQGALAFALVEQLIEPGALALRRPPQAANKLRRDRLDDDASVVLHEGDPRSRRMSKRRRRRAGVTNCPLVVTTLVSTFMYSSLSAIITSWLM